MRRFRLRLTVSACLFVCICAATSVRGEGAIPNDLGPVIEPILQKLNAPAATVAVVRDGLLVATGVSGVRDLQKRETALIGDRSLIGSCGKSATRLLIGRLVDKGKLRWDATLGELLADVSMREEYKSVTIGDIIGHRGGIPSYTMISPDKTPILFNQSGSPREQRAAFVAHVLSEQPSAPPKTKMVYSNAGYGLLGHVAERLADKPYEQLMRDEVFRPLGMSTAIVGRPAEASNVPAWTGHMRNSSGFEPAPARTCLPAIAPAGMMSMSIEDFAKLAAALVQVESRKPGPFLSAAAIEKLPELRPGSSGEGEIFYGGDGHYTAAFALWPSKGLGIVVETNAGSSDDLCEALVKAVHQNIDPSAESSEAARGPEKRGKYGVRLMVEADDDTLLVEGIDSGSPAEKGGLKKGDKILSINGTSVEKLGSDDRMAEFKKSPLKLRVDRDGKPVEVTLQLP